MKSNKWNIIIALLYLTAGSCFVFAAAFHTEIPSKILCGIAATCLLIARLCLINGRMPGGERFFAGQGKNLQEHFVYFKNF